MSGGNISNRRIATPLLNLTIRKKRNTPEFPENDPKLKLLVEKSIKSQEILQIQLGMQSFETLDHDSFSVFYMARPTASTSNLPRQVGTENMEIDQLLDAFVQDS